MKVATKIGIIFISANFSAFFFEKIFTFAVLKHLKYIFMESLKTAKESKEDIFRLTQEILPSADLRRSSNLLKTFRNLKYPDVGIREIAVKVLEDPGEYKEFCETQILRANKLEESAFNHLLNQVDKLNFEQIEILLNRVLMAKLDVLQLINKQNKITKKG